MSYTLLVLISLIGIREPFSIVWNMFQSSSNPEFCCIGFGDWCIEDEGPHPGLDFKPPATDDYVLSPANCTAWVQGAYLDVTGWAITIDDEKWQAGLDCIGWQIGHIDTPLVGISGRLLAKEPIGVGVYQGGSEWFPHIHLHWLENEIWVNNINPFNGYLDPPVGYDSCIIRSKLATDSGQTCI